MHRAAAPNSLVSTGWPALLSALILTTPAMAEPAVVCVVDDDPDLTELYSILLRGAGFKVQAFTDRVEALQRFKAAEAWPNLLITDYRGESMPIDEFIHACVTHNPVLRILMASGFEEADTSLLRVRPDRFLRKPFTPEEFLREVHTALAN
jgi:CheY-like chemotaxis protein